MMGTALRTRSAPNATRLLASILDDPKLAEAIRELPPQVLATLVRRVGLEDAGEIVALATTDQLVGVFDEDLWRNERPGEEESFDAARFVLWLEVLLEAGESFVANRLAELPEDMLTLALHEQLLVLEVDGLAERMLDPDDPEAVDLLDKALTSCLYEELDEYQLIARHPDGWDAVLAAVLALDRDHGELLRRVLDRCVAMSAEYIDDNGGLYEVLTSEEMLGQDVAADRDGRRAAAGYVAPSDATSFLKLAAAGLGDGGRDPVTRAWLREVSARPLKTVSPARASAGLRRVLQAAGMEDQWVPQLSAGEPKRAPSRQGKSAVCEDLVVQALRLLSDRDRGAFDKRQEELAYLANVLVAGAIIGGRRVRPVEAIRAAMAVIAAGLQTGSPQSRRLTEDVVAGMLASEHLDTLFRAGWSWLHAEAARAGHKHSHNDLDVLQKPAARKRGSQQANKHAPERRSPRGPAASR